jgi:glycosyltransferase involved in cell wall biosynthesis
VRRAHFQFNFSPPDAPPKISFGGRHRPDARLQLYGYLAGTDSYSNVFGALAHALADEITELALCNYAGPEPSDPVLSHLTGLNRRARVGIFFGFPTHAPDFFFSHDIRIGICVCETDQILPEWVRACNRFHLIVVPSRSCRMAFLRSGVTSPVMVVPHGVHPQHRLIEGLRPNGRFVFYNSLRSHLVAERKGYRELIRCFQIAFEGRDDIVLRLRIGDRRWLPACPGWPDYGRLVEFDPPGALSLRDAARVYSEVHCTVHPSKGEGFGLVPLESIACETPVIAPATGGMADYLDRDNSICLRPGGVIRAPRVDHQCGRYCAVDEEDLIAKLRHAVDHWTEERDKLVTAGADVRRRYAWPRVLQPIIEIARSALECGVEEFERLAGHCLDPGECERYRQDAERRARATADPGAAIDAGEQLGFSSIVYSGWDYPRDGVGAHLRLLDRLVFNGSGIRYKSLDERVSSYSPELYDGLSSYVHEQRPDLFQNCLYLDVVGLPGGEKSIREQIDRVLDMRGRFAACCAVYLMWETDRLWNPMLDLVRAYDLTIITSSLLEDYLREHEVRFVKLPHPYEYVVRPPVAGGDDSGQPLTLGMSAGLWPRKNLALTAEAFAAVLGGHPDFRLRIHTRTEPRDREAQEEHRRIESALDCGNIELRVASLSRGEYLEWISGLDVYCFLSSGEGWSVTPREALHLGKPVVLLDAHVHAELRHLPGIILVPPGPPRPARPAFRWMQGGIGQEAGVDIEALQRVFSDLPRLAREARARLAAEFEQVLAHHDADETRQSWIRALGHFFN